MQRFIDADGLFWLGFGVLAGACMALPGLLEAGPLAYSVHRAIAADNFTTGCLAFWTAGLLWHQRAARPSWSWDERRLDFYATLMLIVALGVHRLLWAPWRVFLALDDKGLADAYRDTWAQMTSLPQGVWWVSMALVAAPIYRQWYGRSGWPWVALVCIVLMWLTGYQIAATVRLLGLV